MKSSLSMWRMSFLKEFGAAGYILSGGPESVTSDFSPRVDPQVLASGRPILGICYGMHTMVEQLGGAVLSSSHREFGPASVTLADYQSFLSVNERSLDVWMSHGDRVERIPDGFESQRRPWDCPVAAIADSDHQMFGTQFHPEVTHTKHGCDMLRHFVTNICGCDRSWTPEKSFHD